MNRLVSLYAEQTTPNDIIIFLLVGTILTLAIAFIVYTFMLVVIWRFHNKDGSSLFEVLFPSILQMRANVMELFLGTMAALLLVVSVSAKHDVVELILEQDISTIDSEQIKAALPIEELAKDLGNDEFSAWIAGNAAETLSITAKDLVQPLLRANLPESANIIMRTFVEEFNFDESQVLGKQWLVAMAVALLFGYIAWFGWRRWSGVEGGSSLPKYALIIKRLSPPALCIPLVLVSAIELEDMDTIIDRTIAVSASSEIAKSEFNNAMTKLTEEITVRKTYTYIHDREVMETFTNRELTHINNHHRQLEQQLSAIERLTGGLSAVERQWDSHLAEKNKILSDLSELRDQISDLPGQEARLSDLENKLKSVLDNQKIVENLSTALTALNNEVATLRRLHEGDTRKLGGALRNFQRSNTQAIQSVEEQVRELSSRISQLGSKEGLLLVNNLTGSFPYNIYASNGRIVEVGRMQIEIYSLGAGNYTVGPRRVKVSITSGGNKAIQLNPIIVRRSIVPNQPVVQ